MKTAMPHLILIAILGLATSGCSRRQAPVDTGIRDQVLHRGNLGEPKDLDPHTVTGVTEFNIISALLETLVIPDPTDLHPIPGVASSWEASSNRCEYTFHLRPDARWSNGDPVKAGDFAFAWQRILSPRLASPYASMLFVVHNAQPFNAGTLTHFADVGVHVIDDHTLRVTLDHPVPHFLSLLTHHVWAPVHPATILKYGAMDQIDNPWTEPGRYVGNGPFKLQAWERNSRIVVVKNTNYWDVAKVKLQQIVFYPIGDHKIEENAFRAGQLHITGTVPLDRIDYYRRQHPDLIHLDPYLGTYYYMFNIKRPPLNNPKVRRALAMAIDRDQITRFVTKAGEAPAFHFTPPDTAGYTSTARLPTDIPQARRLLAEAGFPGGKGFPHLSLLYNTSDAHERIAQTIQQMWQVNLGINIELVNMEGKVCVAQMQAGDYDIGRAGWIGDYLDPMTFLDLWMSNNGNNRTGWSSPEYDRLLATAAATADPQARRALLDQAENLLMQEAPIMPIYFYRSKALIHPAVKGWHANLLDVHPYKFVYLEDAPP